MSDRRPRKKNFLLSKYKQNKKSLESKLNNFVTNKWKQQIWEDITDTINAKGVEHRDVKDVRKKWSDLKMQAVDFHEMSQQEVDQSQTWGHTQR